jgi:glycine oxidase
VNRPSGHPAPCDAGASDGCAHDAIVVGGGVIGLSVAWRVATAGMRVGVVDPEPGRKASWAAAGMLAPVTEVHFGEEALLELNLQSSRRWPAFASELEAASGRRVGYRRDGTVLVALDRDDRAWAQQLFEFQHELGLDVRWMNGRLLRELEPNVSPRASAGLFAAGDHQVDNRLLVLALLEAARLAGCCFHHSRVRSVEISAGTVEGVRLDEGGYLGAPAVVLAAGAWSGALEGLPEGAIPPVRPVKGQILRLRATREGPVLKRCVRGVVNGSSVYIVPRSDGTVVVGATVEERGFDTSVTAQAVYELLRDAHRVVPGVGELELTEVLAGLRPGSPDNSPIVGPLPAEVADGLFVATGHYRNGILQTPLTADATASMLCGGPTPEEVLAFSPGRFQMPSWSK